MLAFDQIKISSRFLRSLCTEVPKIGLVTGSGLGAIPKSVKVIAQRNYEEIPNFYPTSAPTHSGTFYLGKLGNTTLAILSGRFHAYEGLSMQEVVFPVRVLAHLGIEILIVTNVAGGLNPNFKAGDLVLLSDHINLMGKNPLIGPNDDRLGVRFPDMSNAYDLALRQKAHLKAKQLNLNLYEGVYAGVLGPSLETKSEYAFLRRIGADLVGMSTVPEVIAARHMKVRVIGISVVSNVCFPISIITPTRIEDVIGVAEKASEKLNHFLEELIRQW